MKNIFILLLLTVSSLVLAHHSPAVFYQMDKTVTVTGTVTEFRMGNPHIRVYFDMNNASGDSEQWMAEGGSRTVLLRHGWRGDEVKPGDVVTIHGHPSREDKNIVHMIEITLDDGNMKYAEDLNPEYTENLLEERRRRRN
ncbi:MAG: DUF6152 family protein [Gammaproteobacteria bacterium]|nr:DUF6152 family protein [Gammaproteobacteria bacterium]